MVLKCIVAYDGTNYKGWQLQPGLDTVQKRIEDVLATIHNKKRVEIVASGRTDAQVHARGQVFHFVSDKNMPMSLWKHSMNRMLPHDIRICCVEQVHDEFHARFDCISKRYDYLISSDSDNPFIRNYMCIETRPLDIERMKEACSIFEGCHDFTSFTSADIHEEKSRIRTITQCSLHEHPTHLQLTFIGDGFLRYQVRMMSQTIIEAGLHHLSIKEIAEMLRACDKHACRYKAKACGLYLMEVNY